MVRERDERVELEYLAASDDDSGGDDEDNRMLVQLIDLIDDDGIVEGMAEGGQRKRRGAKPTYQDGRTVEFRDIFL